MTLSAAIFMIHQEALIVASQETGFDQFGDRSADGGHARIADTFVHLLIDETIGFSRVNGQLTTVGNCSSNLVDSRASLVMARSTRRDRGREPFADGHQGISITHEGARLPIRSRDPCYQVEHHECVAGPR